MWVTGTNLWSLRCVTLICGGPGGGLGIEQLPLFAPPHPTTVHPGQTDGHVKLQSVYEHPPLLDLQPDIHLKGPFSMQEMSCVHELPPLTTVLGHLTPGISWSCPCAHCTRARTNSARTFHKAHINYTRPEV